MPFEIPQIDAPVRVGRFQKFADAMLRGCAITKPAPGMLAVAYEPNSNIATHACAWYAIKLGGGGVHTTEYFEMASSYCRAYGANYIEHYICGAATREQIAQRIAAL